MSTRVTVIIPVKNGAKTINRAIESALAADVHEILVYDDASTDKTRETVLRKQYRKVYMLDSLSTDPFGYGVNFGRNYMCSLAERSLILPLDADDELLDITPFVDAWEKGVWLYGDHIECDGTNETYHKGAPAGGLARKNITGVTFFFDVYDWRRVGGYDPDFAYAEDYAMQVALTHNGIRPVYVPKPLYRRHLKPEGNERTAKAGIYWQFYHEMARSKWPSVFT